MQILTKNRPFGRFFLFSSECHPHLIPQRAAVLRLGHALADEAELGVIVHQMLLAGEHQALSPLGPGVSHYRLQHHAGASLLPAGEDGIHAEDHLPVALRLME